MIQLDLTGQINEDEFVIQKYKLDVHHKRGTKIFSYWVEHFKQVEKHNRRVTD